MKRFASLVAAACAVATVSALSLTGGAGAASSSLPTQTITLSGKTGVSVSSTALPQGAVNVVAQGHGSWAIACAHPGVSIQDAFNAVQKAHGNEDALTPYGEVIASSQAPGTVQTVLPAGDCIALNVSSQNGTPGFTPFKVHTTGSPATLPAAAATQKSIEFGFKGPKVLHKGTVVRAENAGYLVHMIDLLGLKSKAVWPRVHRMLLAGAPQKKFRPYLTRNFVSLLDPASPGAIQQMTLNAKPGYYVEACFMDTQDGRQHTQLGMERLVRVK
jgi:hypothetical protein